MRQHRVFTVAAILGAIAFGLSAAPPGDGNPTNATDLGRAGAGPAAAAELGPPMLLAHIDLERVFNEINLKGQAEKELELVQQDFQQHKEKLRGEADSLKQDLELLVPGTDQFVKAERKYREAAIAYAAYVEFSKAKLEKKRAEARHTIFERILTSADSFARTRGIMYLLSDDSLRAVEPGSEIQIVQQMAFRRVVYADDAFDVTDELIAWINMGR